MQQKTIHIHNTHLNRIANDNEIVKTPLMGMCAV